MPRHTERRRLPYRPDQMYALVSDIESYPGFLPWCVGARIVRREANVVHADLVIGFKMFRERFSSKVTFTPHHRIDVEYADGPFRYLRNHWIFHPAGEAGCEVDFFVDFEFRSKMLQTLIGAVFTEAVRRMVAAFEGRARQLYGEGAGRAVARPSLHGTPQ